MSFLRIFACLATLPLLLAACSSDDEASSCEGCLIGGTCYPQWVANQENPCQGCDTARSTTAWSDRDGALCDDGLFCNGSDTCGGGTCTTHAGNPCGGGLSCDEDARQCASSCDGCLIAGVCLFDGQRNPLNPCQVCDVSASATELVDDEGTSCDDGLFCNGVDKCAGSVCATHAGNPCGAMSCSEVERQCAGTCEGCLIEGVCLFDGQPNPLNPCQVCDVSKDIEDFVDDDGASCDDGLYCNGSDSCTGGACVVHEGELCGAGEVCWEEFGGRCCSQEIVRGCDLAGRVVDADSCGHVSSTVMDCEANGSTCVEDRCLCDPVAGTGCPAGMKCTSTGARTECVADGTLGPGDPCTADATGADDCAAGLYCYPRVGTGTCLSLCSTYPDPADCAPDHFCTSDLMSAFPDQIFTGPGFDMPIDVGVCKPGCDPVFQDCSNPAQACYLKVPGPDSECADVPSSSEGVTQDQPCNDLGSGDCYVGGCDKGYGAVLPGGTCAFFCTPIDNWKSNLQGLSGDPAGTTCAASFQGARPDGPGPAYECRFIQTYYTDGDVFPRTVGMCVNPASPEGGGSCADFDLQQLVLDVQSGEANSSDYCTLHPNNCLLSCVSQETFDAQFP